MCMHISQSVLEFCFLRSNVVEAPGIVPGPVHIVLKLILFLYFFHVVYLTEFTLHSIQISFILIQFFKNLFDIYKLIIIYTFDI